MTREQLDAYSFNKAIAGLGTDGKLEKNSFSQVSNVDFNFYQQQKNTKKESAIIELLVTRSNEQINAAKAMYQTSISFDPSNLKTFIICLLKTKS